MKIGADLLNINASESRLRKPEAPVQGAKEGAGPEAGLEKAKLEPEFRAAVKLIESKGYKLDERARQGLRDFMQNGEGSVEDKLEAIETALAKELPLKEALLTRLQGFSKKSLLDFLPDALGFAGGEGGRAEAPTSSVLREKKGPGARKGALSGSVKGRISNKTADEGRGKALERNQLSAERAEGSLRFGAQFLSPGNEADRPHEAGGPIDKIDELLRSLLQEIDEEVGADLADFKDSRVIEASESDSAGLTGPMEAGAPAADSASPAGLAALEEKEALPELEVLASYIAGAASINEQFSSRAVMMTEITPKLQGLKRDFEELKLALTKDLNRLTAADRPIKPEEAVRTLEKNIERLDRAIMRSEMSLYMDLKGERELLKMSSQLQEARTLLQEGKITASKQVLTEIKGALEKLDYVPSIKKALLLYDTGIEAEMAHEIKDVKALSEWLSDRAGRYQVSSGTPGSLTSYLRKLGIGAEAENFEKMSLSKERLEAETRDFVSLKGLLKELSASGAKPTDREAANALLGRIEALDLKNKILDTREAQTLNLELPLKLNGSIKSVKVFIQSPQHGRKLDWENFNMFFVLTTERLGELGIKVEAIQKNLSVSILNDEAKKLEEGYNFKDSFRSEVEDLGFRLVKMIMEGWRAGAKSQKPEGNNQAAAEKAREWRERPRGLEEGRFDMRL